jgi:hypothetical protein
LARIDGVECGERFIVVCRIESLEGFVYINSEFRLRWSNSRDRERSQDQEQNCAELSELHDNLDKTVTD